ncbi:GH15 family glucan-1,4-alpha-glucosidase [Glaciihabitans tibetensis]|uniref:GH15 family glucan-1,4-alpha-glucosidase n=1 Tax=Glaciihabitans tibetensis TaxID=1266600 RepID=A0A2T0VIX7_9MICO|nr:glycoside hydrolase family 15 protein [Glaciihabitans tibetensis]PRY70178.1 GH15 family glucan-1,4-alpha-glucosidase [Glaciihabitans tibetensis]
MSGNIEDYALIGDCHTGALVGSDGSVDWLCFPRFDSASTFGALLGNENHGRWLLAPSEPIISTHRRYREDTFVLETRWVTASGEVEVIDFMPHGDRRADLVRRVRGISGSVPMTQDLRIRFDYAAALPWLRQSPQEGGNAIIAIAGPDAVIVRGPAMTPRDQYHESTFVVAAEQTIDVVLTWFPAHRPPPPAVDVDAQLSRTVLWWEGWAQTGVSVAEDGSGLYHDVVRRSLLVLRALTHEDTGGIVAAATTSLPESLGGSRNWDYRYVWLRDASLTLDVLISHGYEAEALSWRDWLLRALAGDPSDVQIMYGLSGERRLPEWEIDSLPGYQGSTPVRAGNAAYQQYQGDIFGEVMLALHNARVAGVPETSISWGLQSALLKHVETVWERPDNGIWEIRGPARNFTHSRAMLWAALDCGVRAVRDFGLDGPADRWAALRDELRDEIETQGYDATLGSYTQYYGSGTVDASLLQLPQIGFIAADDPRMISTVRQIESELMRDGLLLRYRTESGVDGLSGDEHPFLACSFWLAEQYARSGRLGDATALMDRLLGFANDLGLLSEEYDASTGRAVGNVPQALSHLALVRTADAIRGAIALQNRVSGMTSRDRPAG